MLLSTSVSQLRISWGISDSCSRRASVLGDTVLCPASWRALFSAFRISLAGYLWSRQTGSAASGLSSVFVSLKVLAMSFLAAWLWKCRSLPNWARTLSVMSSVIDANWSEMNCTDTFDTRASAVGSSR